MAINITAVGGAGTHSLQKVNVNLDEDFIYFPDRDAETAYPTEVTNNTAWVFRETTGDLTGITSGEVYYTLSDGFSIQFTDEPDGDPIDITNFSPGSSTFNFPFVFNNQFNISSVSYKNQQAVRYLTSGNPINGIQSGQVYYVKNLLTGLGGSSLYTFTSHTFTTAGSTGRTGPTISQLKSSYTSGGASWATNYLAQGSYQGYQDWTVPTDGIYEFTVKGSPGRQGQSLPGGGAIVKGRIRLNKGETITVAVGQRGELPPNNLAWAASSGGTFVVRKAGNIPLFIAGGGSSSAAANSGRDGVLTTIGGTSAQGYTGGQNGNGAGGINAGGGGGGFFSAGGNSSVGGGGGGFNNGLLGGFSGGTSSAWGGFGGGGGSDGQSWGSSGGAGGYGGGATNATASSTVGGGGGSYIFPTATNVATSSGFYENSTTILGQSITNLSAYNTGAVEGEVFVELVESSVFGFTLHETAEDAANDVAAVEVSQNGNSFHALVPLTIDTVGETINTTSPHGLFNGEAITYFHTGTPVADLNQSTVYYVELVDSYTFKLSLTPDPDFTTVNLRGPSAASVEGFRSVVVNISTNTITIPNHGFLTNQPVRYSNGGGTNVVLLQNNATYYIKEVVDENRFKLSQSLNGPEIDLQTAGTGTGHSFIFTVVNLLEDSIYLPSHGYVSGQTVVYAKSRDLEIADVFVGSATYRYITTTTPHGLVTNQRVTFDQFSRPAISTPSLTVTQFSSSGQTRRLTTGATHNLQTGMWVEVEGFTGASNLRFNGGFLVTSIPTSNEFTYTGEENFTVSTTNAPSGVTTIRNSEWDYVTETRKLTLRSISSSGTTRTIVTDRPHNLPSGYLILVEGVPAPFGQYFNGEYYINGVQNSNQFTYVGTQRADGGVNLEESITISTENILSSNATVHQIAQIDNIESSTRFRYRLPQSSYNQTQEFDVIGFTSLIGNYINNRNLTRRTRGQINTNANHNLQVGDRVNINNMTGPNRDVFNGTYVVDFIPNSTTFNFLAAGNNKSLQDVRLFSNTNLWINTAEEHNMESSVTNWTHLRNVSGNDNMFFASETGIIDRESSGTVRTVYTDNPHQLSTSDRVRILDITGPDSSQFIGDLIVSGVPNATTFTYNADTAITVSRQTVTGLMRRARVLNTVPSFSVSAVNRSGNVADVTFNTTHSLDVGEIIRIANCSQQPQIFNGTWTITEVPATNRVRFTTPTSGTVTNVGASGSIIAPRQIRMSIPTYQRAISERELLSHTVSLYNTRFDHGFEVGSTVTISSISADNPNIFNGTYVVASVPTVRSFTVSRTPQVNVTTFTVTSRSRSVNVADITFNTTHNLRVGNSITISNISGASPEVFNGTHVITAIPAANRVQFFTPDSGTVAGASVTGTIQVQTVQSAVATGTTTLNTVPKTIKTGFVELVEVASGGYIASLDSNTKIGGLNNRDTYYVQKLDDSIIRLASDSALTVFPDITNVGIGSQEIITTSIDYDNNTITIPDHGFSLGELVEYDTGGETEIGGLTTATPYYTIPVDGNTLKLANTSNNATNGIAIDLTRVTIPTGRHILKSLIRTPDGTYTITNVPNANTFEVLANGSVPEIVKTFNPRFTVDLTENSIKVPSHGFLTGTKVTYSSEGGTDIGGLTDAEDYFVIVINKDYFHLAGTAEEAASGVDVILISYGAGTNHTFTSFQINGQITGTGTVSTEIDSVLVTGDGTNFSKILKVGDRFRLFPQDTETKSYFESTDVDTSTDIVSLDNHPFITGDSVIFNPGSGGRRREIFTIASSGTTRTIVTGELHGFTTGNTVIISGLSSSSVSEFVGTYTISVSNTTTFTYVASTSLTLSTQPQTSGLAEQSGSGGVAPSPLVEGYYYYINRLPDETVLNLTARDRTTNQITFTTSANHNYQVGNVITVADITGVNPEVFNGLHVVRSIVSATQFRVVSFGGNIGNAVVTGTVTTSSSNQVTLHNLRTEAIAGTNAVDFSNQGSGLQLYVGKITAAPPIVRTIAAIGSDSQITVDRSYTSEYIDIAYSYPTFVYVRPQGYSLHRPFDGGVEMSTGSGTWYGSIIRQTRKYFRYQSGKGIQTSAAINFKPSIDIEAAFQVGASNVIQIRTRRPHGLINGLSCRIDDALDSSEVISQVFNGTFQVSVIDSFNLTVIATNNINESKAYGFPRLHVDAWQNGALRAGMFDFQNGMFYEFDGQKLYAVRRSSTQQIAGTLAALKGSEFVFGTNTSFTTQVEAGDSIVMRGMTYKVANILSDSRLTIKPEYKGASGNEQEFNPTTVVNPSTNIYTIISHGYTQNIPVIYNSIDGNPIGGMVNGRTYYVDVISSNTFRLKPSPDTLTTVSISSTGTGAPHSFTPAKTGIIATKTIDTKVPQEDWSIDPCDGTGPTGYNLDLSKIQMIYMDYSWYGAGKIRFGFKTTNGEVQYTHEFTHNNIQFESYFRSGNLPARYEVTTFDNPSYIPSLFHWGTSVIMDGRFDDDKAYLFTKSSQTLNIGGTTSKTFGSTALDARYDVINIPSHGFATGDAVQFLGIGTNGLPQVNTQNPVTRTVGLNTFSNLQNEALYFTRVLDSNNIALLNTEASSEVSAPTITSISKSGFTVSVTTSAAHGFSTNQWIFVYVPTTNVLHQAVNGVHQITSTGATTFTYRNFNFTSAFTGYNPGVGSLALNNVIDFFNSGNSQSTYRLSPAGTLNNTSGANYQPLLSLRLSPSVSEGLTGKLGDRDIINRMQLRLNEIGVQSNQLIDVKLLLNGRLNNLNFVGVDAPSLVQVIEHTSNDTVSGGVQVYNFKASGNQGEEQSTTVSVSDLFELSNSILGGDSVFPDGPDIITIAVARLTGNETLSSAKMSWSEAQA
jgi:hypothetical protein